MKFYGIAQDGIESAVLYHMRKAPSKYAYMVLDAAKAQSGYTGIVPDDEAIDTINTVCDMLEDVMSELKDTDLIDKLDQAQSLLIGLTD